MFLFTEAYSNIVDHEVFGVMTCLPGILPTTYIVASPLNPQIEKMSRPSTSKVVSKQPLLNYYCLRFGGLKRIQRP